MMGYFYIFGTIFFTVYGQIVLKWRIVKYGALPNELNDKIIFLTKLLFDPWIFSGFFAAFIAQKRPAAPAPTINKSIILISAIK